jgi:hypothetical protein
MRRYPDLVSKLLSAAIGCKARGSALSAKRVLDVLQHASEPFPPSALPTDFSLDCLGLFYCWSSQGSGVSQQNQF